MKQTYFNLFVLLRLTKFLKLRKYGNILLLFLLVLGSCKKELTFKPVGTSSLTIVNGVTGSSALLTNFDGNKPLPGTYYANLAAVYYGASLYFNNYSGRQELSLYQAPDTLAGSKPMYHLTLNLPVNTTHTLFLMGTPQVPDELLTTDSLPYYAPADSTMGIRFVNLSKDNADVSVNLSGQSNGSEVVNLPYKGLTAFKKYPAGSAVNSYTFEFRDLATGLLIGSCTLDGINNDGSAAPNTWRYRNFTLALLSASGNGGQNPVIIVSYNISI